MYIINCKNSSLSLKGIFSKKGVAKKPKVLKMYFVQEALYFNI